jgi:hypothetical protein
MWFVDFMINVLIFLLYLFIIISLLVVNIFNIYLLPITVPLIILFTIVWKETLRNF